MILGGMATAYPGTQEESNCLHLTQFEGGAALLPENLARALGDHLHLNTPLTKISKNAEGSFVLTFQTSEEIQADILVLTIPCPVYQDIHFDKNIIPPKKLEAIKNVHYGTNAKIIVPTSTISPDKRDGCFINDRIATRLHPNHYLLLYYTGASSHFTQDTILQTYCQEKPMIELGFGSSSLPPTTPVIAKDQSFASYEGPVGHSWPNDPYAKGSYSYIAAGQEALLTQIQEDGEESVRTLFAPIDQQLYFAGEHTSILLEVPGTMEAACESGERTARMIVNSEAVVKHRNE